MSLFNRIKRKVRVEHQVSCYSSSSVPGMRIVKSLGVIKVDVSDDFMGGQDDEDKSNVTKILHDEAVNIGGNAIVNFRCVAACYSTGGWSGFTIAYGDAVILEPE